MPEEVATSDADRPAFTRLRYEVPVTRVARIVLSRPEAANAQDYLMLSELNTAFDYAARDPSVSVIILAADGRHFSSGHDWGDLSPDMSSFPVVGTAANFDAPGAEGYMDREYEVYLGYCKRWREIPKPTIAQVHGKVIAGGLMLVWPMDLVTCADDATFSDPDVVLGYNGIEYSAHAFELGVRRAKDILFTGRYLSAHEALAAGMVQRVFPPKELEHQTLALAERIAQQPTMALAMAKRSINFAQDCMGFQQTLDAGFVMHHLMHSHWNRLVGDHSPSPDGQATVRSMMQQPPMPGTSG